MHISTKRKNERLGFLFRLEEVQGIKCVCNKKARGNKGDCLYTAFKSKLI